MADSFLGKLIPIGLLGGAAYFAYQWWTAQNVQAAGVAASGAATAVPPPYTYVPPTASASLQAAGASNSIVKAQGGQADAYQWATIYNGISGLPSISGVNINSTFFPSGLPANQSGLANTSGYSQQGLPLMSAATFIQGIGAAGVTGLSGLGQDAGPRMVPVPIMLTPLSKTRMNLPAGTTPAELQRRLRVRR
jgi:hypothetical protein